MLVIDTGYAGPFRLSYTPDGTRLLLTNLRGGEVQLRNVGDYESYTGLRDESLRWHAHLPDGQHGLVHHADSGSLQIVAYDLNKSRNAIIVGSTSPATLSTLGFSLSANGFGIAAEYSHNVVWYDYAIIMNSISSTPRFLNGVDANHAVERLLPFGGPPRLAVLTRNIAFLNGNYCRHYLYDFDTVTGEFRRHKTGAATHYDWTASPNGRYLAARHLDRLLLWRATGLHLPVISLSGPTRKQFTGLAFHPDGRLLATASNDKCIHVWDLETYRIIHSYDFAVGRMKSIAYAPDGLTAAAGTDDGRLVVFDLE